MKRTIIVHLPEKWGQDAINRFAKQIKKDLETRYFDTEETLIQATNEEGSISYSETINVKDR